ncbi:hypothetical protein Cni_G00929 [Canna indica]|uniref:DUF4228 domain protein n=1 Tax=Canna indica TaxID=4628 RepID=A0AAQ3JLV7_9LILI|nr:hypothetical protein Cni_G00929 [Canna indica]
MGICSSYDATAVAAASGATAKLVLQDGKLQEFARPVKAAHVLQKDPACFVCSADDMEFDDFVAPVNAEDELQPGQLYFLLPVSMLRRRLHADEIAALAVKASAALMGSGSGCHCQCRKGCAGQHLVFPDAAAPEQRRSRRRPGSRRGGGKGRDFKSGLSGIPE